MSGELAARYRAYEAAERARWQELEAAGVRSWADVWEAQAARFAEAVVAEEVEQGPRSGWTYARLDEAADRVAAWAVARGEPRLGLLQDNGCAFLAALIGLAKAGVAAVLFSTREPAGRLSELAARAEVRTVLGGAVPGCAHQPLPPLLAAPWPGPPSRAARAAVGLDDPAVVIFTSGTTGRSKGARFSHRRLIGAGVAWGLRNHFATDDRCYIALPLFHGNGLAVAFAACVEKGARAVLRRRFSASAFASDLARHRCTAVVYIGELWRYLDAQPDPDPPLHLRVIFGNGLPADLWARTCRRYGVGRVVEHWGATELPAGALLNWTGRPGSCGFVPPDHPLAGDLAIVDEQGRLLPDGEAGELLLRVPGGVYRGYLDPADDEPKLWRGLFTEGDVWWRSGDRLRRDGEGFFTFVERLGEGFRWKGENVSAAEVEQALRETGLVREAAVVGVPVPRHEGKAGLASLVGMEIDLERLLAGLCRRLAAHALPRFLELRREPHPTTSTLKVTKDLLAREALADLGRGGRFVLLDGRYQPLTPELWAALEAGALRLAD